MRWVEQSERQQTPMRAKFQRDKAPLGYRVHVFWRQSQQDVYHIYLRIWCPASQDPETQTLPVRADGMPTGPLEVGSEDNPQAIVGIDTVREIAVRLHSHALGQLHQLFLSHGCA